MSIAEEAIYWRVRSLGAKALKNQTQRPPIGVSILIDELGTDQCELAGYCFVDVGAVAAGSKDRSKLGRPLPDGKADRNQHAYHERTVQRALRSLENRRLLLPVRKNSFGCIEYAAFKRPVAPAAWRALQAHQDYEVLSQLGCWADMVVDPYRPKPVRDTDSWEWYLWRYQLDELEELGAQVYEDYQVTCEQPEHTCWEQDQEPPDLNDRAMSVSDEDADFFGPATRQGGGDPVPPPTPAADHPGGDFLPPKTNQSPQLSLEQIMKPTQYPEALLTERDRVLGQVELLARRRGTLAWNLAGLTPARGLEALLDPHRSDDLAADLAGLKRVLYAICLVENDYFERGEKVVNWPRMVAKAVKRCWTPRFAVAARGAINRHFLGHLESDDSRSQENQSPIAVADGAQKKSAKIALPVMPAESASEGWKTLLSKLPPDCPRSRTHLLVVEEREDRFVVELPTKMMFEHFAVEPILESDGRMVSCHEYLSRLSSKPIELKMAA